MTTDDINRVIVENEMLSNISTDIKLPECVEAPLAAGTEVGTVTVRSGQEILCTIPVKTAENVERMGFSDIFMRLGEYLLMRKDTVTG